MPFLLPFLPAIAGVAGAAATSLLSSSGPDPQESKSIVSPEQLAQSQASIDEARKRVATAQGNSAQAAGQTGAALAQQNALLAALQSQGGIQNQSSVFNQQQGLANQLGQMAQGAGPDPAAAMLANSTGQNIASQAALMAGQRGAGANAGLLARQAAMQGGNIQQQAAGQGAVMKANQQLAAIDALQRQQGNMGIISGQQVAQQSGATKDYSTGAQGAQNLALQGENLALTDQGQAIQQQSNLTGSAVGMHGSDTTAAATAEAGKQKTVNGLLGGAGTALMSAVAPGGTSKTNSDPLNMKGASSTDASGMSLPGNDAVYAAQGGEIPNLKENYSGSSRVGRHLSGGNMKAGGVVPGKPKVGGAKDTLKNDTVDAKLSPGEIVIPRSITKSKDPVKGSAKFVAGVLAKNGLRGKK